MSIPISGPSPFPSQAQGLRAPPPVELESLQKDPALRDLIAKMLATLQEFETILTKADSSQIDQMSQMAKRLTSLMKEQYDTVSTKILQKQQAEATANSLGILGKILTAIGIVASIVMSVVSANPLPLLAMTAMTVMNSTGATDQLAKLLTDGFVKMGMPANAADILSRTTIATAFAVVAAGAAGAGGASSAAGAAADSSSKTLTVALSTVIGVAQGIQGVNLVTSILQNVGVDRERNEQLFAILEIAQMVVTTALSLAAGGKLATIGKEITTTQEMLKSIREIGSKLQPWAQCMQQVAAISGAGASIGIGATRIEQSQYIRSYAVAQGLLTLFDSILKMSQKGQEQKLQAYKADIQRAGEMQNPLGYAPHIQG